MWCDSGRRTISLGGCLIGGLVLAVGLPSFARAESRTWTGGVNTDWFNGANWSPAGAPASSDALSVFNGAITGGQAPKASSGGSILLSGAGVSLTLPGAGFLEAGSVGTGVVTLREGADVVQPNVTIVGNSSGSSGQLYVQGVGSTLTTQRISLGVNGQGRMEISGGARVVSLGGGSNLASTVAINAGATGSRAVVTGANSVWDLGTAPFHIGGGTGYLDVQDGGALISGYGKLGINGGRGEASVTGAASRWVASDAIDVGFYGSGSLSISAGGLVSTPNLGTHRNTLYAGTSTITVEGTDSRLAVDAVMNVGKGFDISNSGPASVSVSNAGEIHVGDSLNIFARGAVDLNSNGRIVAETVVKTGAFNFLGGTLQMGRFEGSLLNQAGTLDPGVSHMLSQITGSYSQAAAGKLNIELGGTTPNADFDRLIVGGNLSLNGQLDLHLINAFVPQGGDVFEIVSIAGTATGKFAGLDEGAIFTPLNAPASQFSISYVGGDGNDIVLTAVPEPASLTSLLIALAIGAASRRWWQRSVAG